MSLRVTLTVATVLVVGCGNAPSGSSDGSARDATARRLDATASARDASAPDASAPDATASIPDATASIPDASEADAGTSASAPFAPNEVSILYPLDPDHMLRPADQGAYGALVPRALIDRAAPLTFSASADQVYARLRVVAMRLDPCSKISPRAPCRAELRLVLQPVLSFPTGMTSDDAALHAIYGIPFDDLRATLAAIHALADPALLAERRLMVHPTLEREGLTGPYAAGIRAAILAVAGATRLERLTFMQVMEPANFWTFGGFDRSPSGQYAPTAIPGFRDSIQRLSNNVSTDELRIVVTPSVIDGDDLTPLYDSSRVPAMSRAARLVTLGAALRIESPLRHSAATVDCVRCHLAAVVRRWTVRTQGDDLSQHADLYRSGAMDLTAPETIAPPLALKTFRAFGWIGDQPAISPRVVNETAAVLEQLDP